VGRTVGNRCAAGVEKRAISFDGFDELLKRAPGGGRALVEGEVTDAQVSVKPSDAFGGLSHRSVQQSSHPTQIRFGRLWGKQTQRRQVVAIIHRDLHKVEREFDLTEPRAGLTLEVVDALG
jgi:hypothetical protein